METGIVILGHGSRAKKAQSVFNKIVSMVENKVDYDLVKGAAMELSEPSLEQSVAEIVDKGIKKVNIVPLFLFPGIHIQEDIPELIEELREKYPAVQFKYGKNIGADEKVADILVERIKQVN